ncbi:hypothetical protein BS50DRAFT_236193 [Corynespora cassiicola Philippines]|uniref:Hemerythrin-like domain-containing protein n=1 Tax=Corynespora cassiicola Philippines TaxID=1448308 RepID=A0A2T2P2S8_CORCC|nr:hypothetical protein BS50DRAFT_236193 [Corynespora cassiicola Philippines]
MAGKYADSPLALIPTPYKQTGKTDDFTMDASHMAIVHNLIIRGYNSIYKQAPHIRPNNDVPDFIGYSIAWYNMVINHHRSEEKVIFPLYEKHTGVPGLMDGDRAEHEAFYGGMEKFKEYLDSCLSSQDPKTAFSGPHLVGLMDTFGSALHSHLSHEPVHLASLSKYPQIPTKEIKAAGEKDAMDTQSIIYMLPMLWFNHDTEFEDGEWRDWPGLSWQLKWVMVNVFGWWRSNWWRWGSVGRDGKMVELLALADNY